MNLLLAIYEEHKQRTRHDVFNQREFGTLHITCDVCLYLKCEKDEMDKKEAEYYESQKVKD